jgi:hypothetical protein
MEFFKVNFLSTWWVSRQDYVGYMSCMLTCTFEQNGCQRNAAFGTFNLIVLVSNWSASSKISISTCRPSQLAFCACAFHGRSAVHTCDAAALCTGKHVGGTAGRGGEMRGREILTHLLLRQVAMSWLAILFLTLGSAYFASLNVQN